MVAVIDAAAELAVEIGAAAPAGLRARLVQDDGMAAGGETRRRGEPGQPGADDMDPPHQIIPWRSASQSLTGVGVRTGRSRSRQSAATSRSKVAR